MRMRRPLLVFLALSWVCVVLYPDPTLLARSIRNISDPDVDAGVVAALASRLPDDPRLIEAYVLDRQVPYAYDWQTWGVPWYFPTTSEALAAGRGDCESRAVVLSSILTAKGIPHALRVSIGHIWVEYPGKAPNAAENAGLELAGTRDGRFFIQWPRDFEPLREIEEQIAIHWTPAPFHRVVLLFAGLLLIALWNTGVRRLGGPGAVSSLHVAAAPVPPRGFLAARPYRV